MTRDEAIAQSKRFLGSNTEEAIDLWAALGMLKLEEPKSAREKFEVALGSFFSAGSIVIDCALRAFDESQK